ncbi:GPO family capsid scaffolding protein [Sphingobium yanoikuyae]|uniref:GPO family capsid scaffolding protein n=1 Tax=Sphingobium yanoikuyae TaxID=13690 RepID=UPI0008472A08|nr:GPO family capsid scaffolding protein [Sphingobium yanoikuyae]
MAKISKFHRVAVEGATVDGRTIERSWIQQMAETFNPATYGVRVNMEHIRGITADGPFKAYGDVRAVKAQEDEIDIAGKKAKKLCLYAQIEPTDELVAYNQKAQKIFTSVEIQPDFAKSGKAALVGLAVTDSPASLGTEALQFSASKGDQGFLVGRKQDPGNFFSEAVEVGKLEFDDAPGSSDGDYKSMFAAAAEFFKGLGKGGSQEQQPAKEEPTPANDNDARFAQLMTGMEKMTAGMTALSEKVGADVAALKGEITGVKASIDTTEKPGQPQRPKASGGHEFKLGDF